MTVKDLKEKLSCFDDSLPVVISNCCGVNKYEDRIGVDIKFVEAELVDSDEYNHSGIFGAVFEIRILFA